jgi:hypothetical protein
VISYAAIRIIENHLLLKTVRVEVPVPRALWPRLKHWWRYGFGPGSEYRQIPDDQIIMMDGKTAVMHPVVAAELRRKLAAEQPPLFRPPIA